MLLPAAADVDRSEIETAQLAEAEAAQRFVATSNSICCGNRGPSAFHCEARENEVPLRHAHLEIYEAVQRFGLQRTTEGRTRVTCAREKVVVSRKTQLLV